MRPKRNRIHSLLNNVLPKQIGTRLMALYVLLLLVPIMGIGFYGQYYVRNNLQRHILQDIRHVVDTQAQSVDVSLGQVHDDIRFLEARIADLPRSSTANLNFTLTSFAQTQQRYHQVAWLQDDGTRIAGALEDDLQAWAQSEQFQTISNLQPDAMRFITIYSEADATSNTQEALLLVIVKRTHGILLLHLNSPYFMQSIVGDNNSAIRADISAQIMNGGTPITQASSSTDEARLGTWALLLNDNVLLSASPLSNNQTLRLQDFETVTNEHASGTRLQGDDIIFYNATGPGDLWYLLYRIPQTAILPDMSDYYLTFTVVVIGSLISVLGLALLAIGRMLEPIYQLEDMVDTLRTTGETPVLPKPIPRNEFGKLMTTFNHMARELVMRQRNERALIEQLIHAQEDERKRIAYDLHDGLIQELVGARFLIGEARETCPVRQQLPDETPLDKGYDLIKHAIAEGRRIMQGLHPTVLEDLGLEAALRELAKNSAQKAGWKVTLHVEPITEPMSRTANVCLYRITQEALNNAYKHAEAKHITLTLNITKNTLNLCIKDDGKGFDVPQASQPNAQHWGIRTMQERATMLGGTCNITSSEEGTTLCVTMPYLPSNTSNNTRNTDMLPPTEREANAL
jgi:signal transduction histidine kinase